MIKAQFISLTTLALFSVLLLMYFSFYETNMRFNDLTVKNIISEELIFQSETINQAIENILNADYKVISDEIMIIKLDSTLSSGMNPLSNLSTLNTFIPYYNTKISPEITYSLSILASDLGSGFYERIIKPTDNLIQFNYNDDKIRITNASKVLSYTFRVDCGAPITQILWDNNPPTGSDVAIRIVHYNGTVSTYTLSSSNNNECTIRCGGDDLLITYNYMGQNRIEIFYNEFSMLDFGLELGFNPSYGNVFKISSPYSLTNVTLSYKDYTVARGFI
ncbi:MAG: hypothetical protein JW791_01070 [Nanoarchaeota archaeon]|nr:hypothetical protein [Nanoarchaeota archaeon]